MKHLQLTATSTKLRINALTWCIAPTVLELCDALGGSDLTDGDFVICGGKKELKFRYFDQIGILERLEDNRAKRITVHLFDARRVPKKPSPYGSGGLRPTVNCYQGDLIINDTVVRAPFLSRNLPQRGDFSFEDNIATGKNIDAMVAEDLGYLSWVLFEFHQ